MVIVLCISICPIIIFNLLSCTDQINSRLSRARLGQVDLGLRNGSHKAEVFVFAAQTCVCSLTLLRGSTIYQTHTGELERLGRGSAMVPVDLRSKSTLTHQPTLPSGEETYFLNSCYFLQSCCNYQSKKSLYSFVLPSIVQHPSAALPQVFAVPHHWTSVQLMVQLKPTMNPTLSALFTFQVPLTAQFTPTQEIRAPLNALYIQ